MGGVVECIRKDFSIKSPKTDEDYDKNQNRFQDIEDNIHERYSNDFNSVSYPKARIDQQRNQDKKILHYQDNFLEKKTISQTFSYKPSRLTGVKFGFDN